MPDRHAKLIQLRKELEVEEAVCGLYPVPNLNKELKDASQYARSRATSILGFDPKLFQLIFNETGGILVATDKPKRAKGELALQKNREHQERQNEAAKKQLEAEGLI
jgi:hypothetical protein